MSETAETYTVTPAKRRGRPRTEETVFYREGGRVKAYNPKIGAKVNTGKIPANARLYEGLAADWLNWGSDLTADGDYNTARTSPFRNRPADTYLATQLDRHVSESGAESTLLLVLQLLELLYAGLRPQDSRPVLLAGTYWTRFFASVFVREAGVDGINRMNRQPVAGKVWASVNTLPAQGSGYNYTEEAWYSVVNAVRPPLFCVRVTGSEYLERGSEAEGWCEEWPPERLAEAVLSSLRLRSPSDSCAADVKTDPEPPHASETLPETAPFAPEEPRPCEETADATPPENAGAEPEAEVRQEEAEPVEAKKTWGEYLDAEIWMKGLTTSKDLAQPVTLGKILDNIANHEVTKRLTEGCAPLAKIYQETGDKKPLNEYKRDNLRVWYASPAFADRFKGSVKSNVKGYTGLACLDFDGLESRDAAEQLRDTLFMEFPEVLFSAVSASGLGAYCLVALDFDGTDDGYRAALDCAFQLFESRGYMPDTGCCDPTRARYLSADTDSLNRPAAYEVRPVTADGDGYRVLPATLLRQCWTNGGRKKKGAGYEYLKEALERVATAPDGMKDTVMTSVMGTAARLIRNYALDPERVYAAIRKQGADYGFDERKTEDKIRRLGVRASE